MTPAASPRAGHQPTPRGPFFLLGVMTLLTLGGPLLIVISLRGGTHRRWPPDRPIEWITVVGVVVGFVVVLALCLWLSYRMRAALRDGGPRS